MITAAMRIRATHTDRDVVGGGVAVPDMTELLQPRPGTFAVQVRLIDGL
jgi:hypothetical protein